MPLSDILSDGSAFYATTAVGFFFRLRFAPVLRQHQASGVTYQIGADVDVRSQFVNNSVLLNSQDTQFRAISDRFPVFAFAHDLGQVSAPTAPVVYSIGHVRDPVVQYIILSGGMQARSSYFWTRFAKIGDAVNSRISSSPAFRFH